MNKLSKFLSVLLTLFLFVTFSANCFAGDKPKMVFETTTIDMGQVKLNSKKTVEYTFKNEGEGKLIIYKAYNLCACTSIEAPDDPIAKGQTGKIKVEYDSTGIVPGKYQKKFTIIANTSEQKYHLVLNVEIVK